MDFIFTEKKYWKKNDCECTNKETIELKSDKWKLVAEKIISGLWQQKNTHLYIYLQRQLQNISEI